jgi:hypothetical protein
MNEQQVYEDYSAFWRFVRETAAKAEAMPHWKWGPREGCSCEWCVPKVQHAKEPVQG